MLLATVVALAATVASPIYRSVTVDRAGQLHILLDAGREILPKKIRGQIGFGSPQVAPDGGSVGWLVLYPDPDGPRRDPMPGKLAIFRSGRVVRIFDTEQAFWDWQFQDGGRRVAYSTGPMHGGAVICELRDVATGRSVATWPVTDEDPPDWAASLRR